MARIWWVVGALSIASCDWSSPDPIDGAFTPEQWADFQTHLALPDPQSCSLPGADLSAFACAPAKELARQLFAEPLLSCDPKVANPCTPVSCESCHDPRRGYIDSRALDKLSAAAVGWTTRNSMSVLNDGYKELLAGGRPVFTASGGSSKLKEQFTSAGAVLDLAIRVPMKSSHQRVAAVVRSKYLTLYTAAFGAPTFDDDALFANLEHAFDAYLATLVTHDSPFDVWLRGDNPSTMSESAKRGFAIFAGKGGCIECHNGPLLSDLDYHDTGVQQGSPPAPLSDTGRGEVTMDPADNGKFLTAPLRDIAATGPYMHDGFFDTLSDVISFYRRGGDPGNYSGTRDPRITPLDLTDDDAADLEAFLRSLSDHDCDDDTPKCPPVDAGVDAAVDAPAPRDAVIAPPDAAVCTVCATGCFDLQTDPNHCGACANSCVYPNPNCVMGQCGP